MQFVVLPGQSNDVKGFGKLNEAAPRIKRKGRGRLNNDPVIWSAKAMIPTRFVVSSAASIQPR